MLLATYGFRSGEVTGLCLEDVNWESEIISISRPKQRRAQEYPLVSQVGEAILRYLQHVRLRCARREIFLTYKAPFLPAIAGRALPSGQRTSGRTRNPDPPPRTALLRHACAGHLVAEGFLFLKQIGDHLWHRSAEATRIYAKVDLVGLREVANFDLGGLR